MEWLYAIGEYTLALNFARNDLSSYDYLRQLYNTFWNRRKYQNRGPIRYLLHAHFLTMCSLEKLGRFEEFHQRLHDLQSIIMMLPSSSKACRRYQNRLQIKKINIDN